MHSAPYAFKVHRPFKAGWHIMRYLTLISVCQFGCPLAKGPFQLTVALLVIVYGIVHVRVTLVFTQNVMYKRSGYYNVWNNSGGCNNSVG